MIKSNAVFVVALLLANACGAAPRADEQVAREIVYRFGEGYTQAAIDLAAPSKVRTFRAEAALVRKEFRGSGIAASWLVSPAAPDKQAPIALRVSRPGHLVSELYIGTSSPADIQKQLGAPDESGPNWMAYRGLAEICSDKFTFRFAEGTLSEVAWEWCTD
ncbi:hypothetical protein [Paucibacter sp. KCTC 42545]|uniref:hypothetical protein n=1 Tax=Paucibacter sp. KCTC 42545 TaxID=1768242 RepID=UPI0012E3AAA6|nr:hypothetical protein [Paucibacter sp. KCTC 42545]